MSHKNCSRCGREVFKDSNFCPICGFDFLKEKEEKDFGLLGMDDEIGMPSMGMGMPFGMDKILNSLMSQLEKQMSNLDKEMGRDVEDELKEMKKPLSKSNSISISISSSNGQPPEIKISGFGPGLKQIQKETIKENFPERYEVDEKEQLKRAALPRKDPEASVRRLSNKIVYELTLPGVKSMKDIVINKLENSVEIKAFSKHEAYSKVLPIKLPLIDHKLSKEKLVLEFKA